LKGALPAIRGIALVVGNRRFSIANPVHQSLCIVAHDNFRYLSLLNHPQIIRRHMAMTGERAMVMSMLLTAFSAQFVFS
jgi:hypothetical protein